MGAVLGLNVLHGDAAAALVEDGTIKGAVAEERFRRVKHWAGLPLEAIRHTVDLVGGSLGAIEALAVARAPRRYLWRKAALALSHPRSLARALSRVRNLRAVERLRPQLAKSLGVPEATLPPLHAVEHHLAHIASAFHCGPFEEAAVLTVDGFGDFVSSMWGVGAGSDVRVLGRVHYPHSLGVFYTALTQHLGFPHYGDEYKVMGLSALGEPRYLPQLRQVVHAAPEGAFRLDLRYFRHLREGVSMTWTGGAPVLSALFGPALERLLFPSRHPEDPLEDRHRDLAASVQALYEERFFALVRALLARTAQRRLCLAGGCAQNSLANGKLYAETGLEDLWVPPAPADDGTALGAALWVEHVQLRRPRRAPLTRAGLGPEYDEAQVRRALAEAFPSSEGQDGVWNGIRVERAASEAHLLDQTAAAIAAGEVVGWFQGRAEWGPRALGHRSILADPRRADIRDLLNRKIKRRESFRPFAPSVLLERTGEWFTHSAPVPFMSAVYPIRHEKRAQVPAVTHVDGTGRLQTVSEAENARQYRLLRAFEARTGVPMVVNTSFNENEPIVNRPEEAIACFLRTHMDRLVLGDVVVVRAAPRPA